MEDLGPIFHNSGKVILVNNHIKRIDYLKHIDGLFDEFTYAGTQPDDEVDQFYLDYGPLMKLMQNRQWVLEPHVVSVENNLAKANIFKIPDGYSLPVVYGEAGQVRVKIANLEGWSEQMTCAVYHPGKEMPVELKMLKNGNAWYVDVPLERGCGMLKLNAFQ